MAHATVQGHLEDDLVGVEGVGGEQEIVLGRVTDQFCDVDGHFGGFEIVQVFYAADYASSYCNKKKVDVRLYFCGKQR